VLKGNQPLTREAVALSFADPGTPRARLVAGDRHGDREERRTLEASTEVVADRAEPEEGALEEAQIGDWPGLGQVCRVLRAGEHVGGERAGETTREEADASTRLSPARADPARLLALWRGQWPIETGLHDVRDVTLGEDARQVRSGHAPSVLAACRNTTIGLLRRAGHTNVAAARRRHAMPPREALALLGI